MSFSSTLSRFIPKDITEAEKQGFSSPDASWFKGESIDFVKSKLLKESASIYQILDRKKVKSMIEEHLNGKQNRRLLIPSQKGHENHGFFGVNP